MPRVFLFFKVMMMLFILASCSYEPDPGLNRNKTNATGEGKDALKNKTKAEKLSAKYTALKATCEMKVVKTAISQAPQVTELPQVLPEELTVAEPSDLKNPISIVDGVLNFDLKIQAEANPDLSQNRRAVMEKLEQKLRIEFDFKPLEIKDNMTQKLGNTVYLRKHTPVVAAMVNMIETQDTKAVSIVRDITIYEGIPATYVLKTEVTATERTEYVLVCALTGAIKEEFSDQLVNLNCLEAPTEKNKNLHRAYCK